MADHDLRFMGEKKQTVTVNIFGEEYPIRGDADSEYIIEVASYLDKKMREVAEKDFSKSPAKVAILAALNIADELFQARKGLDNATQQSDDQIQVIVDWLDARIPELKTG